MQELPDLSQLSDNLDPAEVHPVPGLLGPSDPQVAYKLPWHKRILGLR